MYIANILAGGHGSRMNSDLPKQFLELNSKPILIHTLEKFLKHNEFKHIVIATPKEFIKHTQDIINKHIDKENKILICEGGNDRAGSIINSIKRVEEELKTSDFTIITHDSARPLVDSKIIKANIEASKNKAVVNTVVASTDTIIESKDSKTVSKITERKNMYLVQTPQTFNAKQYMELIAKTDSKYTDACSLFVASGIEVKLVQGSTSNMKLTTKDDLVILESLIKKG